jgi:hypothetical protein
MQIILSPVDGGANFLLDVAAGADVATLRAECAQRVGVAAARVKLVCEGLELRDGAALSDFYVAALSTVRLVVRAEAGGAGGGAGDASAAAGAAAAAPPAAAADDFNVVLDAEMPRAIVLTNIPDNDAATTERCIFETFSAFGPVARIIFQNESAERQHAVIIYHSEASAAASLAADGTHFMGEPVHVVLASALLPPPPPAPASPAAAAGAGAAASGGPRRPTLASSVVADMLAQGFLYGVQGVAHMKRLDSERGLSQRVSVVAENVKGTVSSLDQRYRVSTTVLTGYEHARQQTLELDSRYGISHRVAGAAQSVAAAASKVAGGVAGHAQSAAQSAAQTAQAVAGRALENPHVASAVAGAQSFFAQAGSLVGGFVEQARTDVKNIEQRIKAAAATPPPSMPPPPASAAGDGGAAGAAASGASAHEIGAAEPLAAASVAAPAASAESASAVAAAAATSAAAGAPAASTR